MPTAKKKARGQRGKDKPKNIKMELVITAPKKRVSPMKGKKTGRPLPPAMRERVWKPGQSGNPSGVNGLTNKKSTNAKLLSTAYRIQLTENCDLEGYENLTWAEVIAIGMAKAAMRGDTPAAKELRESTEGKVPDNIRLGNPDGTPMARPIFDVKFVTPAARKVKK